MHSWSGAMPTDDQVNHALIVVAGVFALVLPWPFQSLYAGWTLPHWYRTVRASQRRREER